MKLKADVKIGTRPTGISRENKRQVNNEYRIGNSIDEVKDLIFNARKTIMRKNIENSLLKNIIIMNIGKAFQERNNPDWFDEDYSFNDFLKEYRIVECTAYEYEKIFSGLIFYKNIGIDIIEQPIRNLRELTNKNMVEYVEKNPGIVEKEIFSNPKIKRKTIIDFKKDNGIITRINRDETKESLFSFNITSNRSAMVIEISDISDKNKVIQLLSKYGKEKINDDRGSKG